MHPDIRDVVQGLAARQGGKPVFDTQWCMYLEAGSEEEKVRFLRAIAQVDEGALLDELLRRSLTPEVRVHNTVSVVVSVASNRRGRDLAWQFLKENWDELDRRYGEGGFGLMRLVSLTQRFSTLRMHDEVEVILRRPPGTGRRAHRAPVAGADSAERRLAGAQRRRGRQVPVAPVGYRLPSLRKRPTMPTATASTAARPTQPQIVDWVTVITMSTVSDAPSATAATDRR